MPKILVVDDEERIRDILKEFLIRMGFHVILATSGDDAIVKLSNDKSIDLMILDMRMPAFSGIDVLSRKDSLKDTRPVILLTGTVSRDNASPELKRLGVSGEDIIYKPFDLFEILARVKKKLNIQG